jgi:hypothetical protein
MTLGAGAYCLIVERMHRSKLKKRDSNNENEFQEKSFPNVI